MLRIISVFLLVLAAVPAARATPLTYSVVEGARGVPLLVAEGGKADGPEILLIHGMSQSHLSWLPQFQSDLAQRFRLVAFDLRGHGGSAKPWTENDYSGSKIWADDIAAVIAAKRLKRPTIVAWSFGGHAAVSYLRHYGAAGVQGLNLSGTLAGLVDVPRKPSPHLEKILAGSRKRGGLDLGANIEGYREMPKGFTARRMPAAVEQIAFLTGLMHPSYVRRAMTGLPLRNEDMPAKIEIPVLITVGSEDREWPLAYAEALAGSLPKGRLSVYRGKGHFPSVEDVTRFNRELAALAAP